MTDVLAERILNRTLLQRQFLLERTDLPVETVVDRLVGLQAQAPLAPYVALWSRISDFRPEALAERIADRGAVRATAMLRGTIHLFGARDALDVRPVVQPVLERAFAGSPFARNLAGVDLDALLAAGRAALEDEPLTIAQLAARLRVHWPDRDGSSLSYAVRYLVPLVQVPPRGLWGATGPARLATTERWLGRSLGPAGPPDALVLRYLAAFGPASVADIGTWSWLTGLREVIERLRPRLRVYHDGRGRELFDLPEAALADAEAPAPVRFLPEYDNVLLSHADRSRIIPPGWKIPLLAGNGGVSGTVLVDGYVRGVWRIARGDGLATLTIEPVSRLDRGERAEVETEGDALLGLVAPDADDHVIRFAPTD